LLFTRAPEQEDAQKERHDEWDSRDSAIRAHAQGRRLLGLAETLLTRRTVFIRISLLIEAKAGSWRYKELFLLLIRLRPLRSPNESGIREIGFSGKCGVMRVKSESAFSELASIFVRFDHFASVIVNANHGVMWAVVELRVADCIADRLLSPATEWQHVADQIKAALIARSRILRP
jgi:hypothetical protein